MLYMIRVYEPYTPSSTNFTYYCTSRYAAIVLADCMKVNHPKGYIEFDGDIIKEWERKKELHAMEIEEEKIKKGR